MRILIAEDEEALNKALVLLLKKNNYTVDSVFNGGDALDYILSGLYDLAILDVMMPVLDGFEVLKKMRDANNHTPVIMLTAKSQPYDKVYGLDLGADDYMAKPFNLEELLARIRAVTRRKSSETSTNTLSFGNLTLDLKTFEIKCGDSSEKLSHKEFQIIEMLIKNPKTVISAERFMDKIWDADSDTEQNVVWVYISGIRKKLARINADVTIKTSRNLGYYLCDND